MIFQRYAVSVMHKSLNCFLIVLKETSLWSAHDQMRLYFL